MQQLMILRHAKAVPWHAGRRGLSPRPERGRQGACCPGRPLDLRSSATAGRHPLFAGAAHPRNPGPAAGPAAGTGSLHQLRAADLRRLDTHPDHAAGPRVRRTRPGADRRPQSGLRNVGVRGPRTVRTSTKSTRLPTGTLLVVDFETGWPDDAGQGRLSPRRPGQETRREDAGQARYWPVDGPHEQIRDFDQQLFVLLVESLRHRAVEVENAEQHIIGKQGHNDFGTRIDVAGDVPAKACTSATRCTWRVCAAVPQTPRPSGMVTQAGLPWNGPTTSSPFLRK